MIRKAVASIAATALLALGTTAGAEIRPKSFTFSPFLGGYTFEGDQHIETGPVFGARLGYDYTKRVGVEALADFGKTESLHHNPPKRDIRLTTGGLEGLYYFFPDGKLVPFLAGGVRVVDLNDKGDKQDITRAGISYGAGAKYALAKDLALRADVRHILLADEGINNLEYTLGLAFAFGGKTAPPPPPPPAPAPPPPPARPSVSLTANPASIEAGRCTDLSWNSANATSASIDQGVGSVPLTGSKQVCPQVSTTYTATANGPGGSATSSASVGVKQPPPPPPPPPPAAPTASISANPPSIEKGRCTDLSWNSSNATSASIDQGVGNVALTGSKQVCPPASAAYTITASGPGGSRTATTSVSVTQPPPPPPPPAAPSVSITANPPSIEKGKCSELSWNSANATSASIDQGVGAVALTGSKQVCPAADTPYTITASGPGGTRTASATVAVAAPREPTKEELTITLAIEFDTDKSVIKAKYEPEVERVAEFMKKYPQVKGVIEGHTDNVGGKAYNEKLSLRRANAVKERLVRKYGIDAARLTTAGYGFAKPVADNKTEEGRQQNRRIVANFDKVTVVKP